MVAALAVLAGCKGEEAEAPHPPRLVKAITVGPELSNTSQFTGTVQARVQTSLAFRLVGRLISRSAEVSDVVRKGDVIGEIDPVALQLAVQKAQADLREAEARRVNAVTTEKRSRSLADRSLGSVADLELAEQGLKSAEAGVVRARANLVKAREQLSYTELRAEFDGVVTTTDVEVGQTVTAGQPVLTLARLGPRDVAVDVSEAELGSLALGTRFDVALQLDGAVRTTGTLREISPEADANTRMHRVKIAIDQAPTGFRLGSIVTVRAARTQSQATLPLPASAVFKCKQGDCVWVIDPKTLTLGERAVAIDNLSANDRNTHVLSGLRQGEKVVVVGINELNNGQIVRLEGEPRS